MSLQVPNIRFSVHPNETCNGLSFQDTTGNYDPITNPLGWGLPEGAATTSVTTSTLTLTNETTGSVLQYIFTVNNGAITDATLSVDGGDASDIISELSSTAFPFTSVNEFDLTADYGVTTPSVDDGVYRLSYINEGTAIGSLGTPEAFDYDTQNAITVDCSVCCCITKLFQSLDADCCCDDKKWLQAMKGYAYMRSAAYITEANGDVEKAVANLKKASEICNNGCGC